MPLALITGATAGIGQATARKLNGQGYDLWLTGRRQDRLEKLKTELATKNGTVIRTFCFDIQNRQEVDAFLAEVKSELGKVDVLINNAGLAKGTEKLQDSKIDDWETMIDTNIKGLLYLTRGVLPAMIAQKTGTIINMGSAAGRWVYPGGAVYCASKFAVRAISEGIRMDSLGSGVRVCTVEPGMVETEFSVIRFGAKEKADKVYAGMKPLTAEDIAETICWVLAQPPHVNIQEVVMFPTDQAAIGQVHRS